MTKKKVNKNVEKKEDKDLKELEEQLQEELNDKNCKDELEILKKENEKLKRQLQDKEEILKNTQVQYLSLKNEFDAFTKRVEENKAKHKDEIFEKTIIKFLPILEDFMKSYEHLPEEFKEHKWTEGLNLINKKINSFLQEQWIEMIPTIWEQVDEQIHEVIWMHPVDDEKKWKIIQEVKKWYVIKKQDKQKVLLPAKVILWQ